ncbi:hypothetical protein ACHAWT_001541 [Skeletonema menzelii]
MYRIQKYLSGSAEEGNSSTANNPRNPRYDYSDSNNDYTSTRRYPWRNKYKSSSMNDDDDLYLSDDDEWGMSALSATQTSLRNESGGSSSAFWDQKSPNKNQNNSRGPPPPVASNRSGLQEWEREAMMRDHLDDAFEIGDDNYYRSESGKSYERNSRAAYDEVQEDLTSLEEAADDNASQSSSKAEDVANAYRDYLRSIRDGGFESYLTADDEYGTPDFTKNVNSNTSEIDQTTERGLDMEEERHQSLYGDLYGVRDVRSSDSPYKAWRAKAKVLLQKGEEREAKLDSPSQRILDKFRRKRNKNVNRRGHRQSSGRDGPYENGSRLDGFHSYKSAVLQNPKFQRTVFLVCLILGLTAGLSYYKKQDEVTEISIPPKPADDGPSMTAIPQNNQQQPHNNHNQTHSNAQVDAITNAIKTFDPTWYSRMTGWEGITYKDAQEFCITRDRVICAYEMYCNDGPNGIPYGGMRPNGEQWAPVSNGENQYVQVGEHFACKRYTDLHDKKKPEWGLTGLAPDYEHGAGGITQNILCCKDVSHLISKPVTEWGAQDALENAEEDKTQEITNSAIVNVEETEMENNRGPNDGDKAKVSDNDLMQEREKAVIAAFRPIWFASEHGWSSGSYEDAVNFCESYNHMVLCPYAAYCPNGPGTPPIPGSMILQSDGEEWAPSNGPMNTWVQVGTIDGMEDTMCTLHHELLGERPKWGTDKTRPDVKHHIMCCLM